MALRFAGDSAAARALPPLAPPSLPNATAAGFFSRSAGAGGALPVAVSTMNLASWLTSRGRFGLDIVAVCRVNLARSSMFGAIFQTDPLPETGEAHGQQSVGFVLCHLGERSVPRRRKFLRRQLFPIV